MMATALQLLGSEEGSAPMFSIEAERSVIGGMLVDPERIGDALQLLQESDFYRESHRKLFRAIADVWRDLGQMDLPTMADRLRTAGEYEATGGAAYLSELWEYVVDLSDLEHHARLIRRHAMRRRAEKQAREVQLFVRDNAGATEEEIQAEAERLIGEIAPPAAVGSNPGFIVVKELLLAEMERLEHIGEPIARAAYIDTGLSAVDGMLGGMEKGDLVLLAARPSMGKSAMGLCNIAAHAAIGLGKRTAVFSVETKRDKVVSRLLGSEARVNMAAMRKRGSVLDEEYARLAQAVGLLNTAPLHIDHTPGLTLDQMRVKTRKLSREHGPVELIVVDYLGLMSHPKAKDRYAEVSEISRGLKRIAGEFDVPVVALSQLSRAVEARPDKKPMMSDLRESGTLEQDADVVMLLFRPEYYFPEGMKVRRGKETQVLDVRGKAEVILAKVREGETGTAKCLWLAEYTHFEDPQQGSFFG